MALALGTTPDTEFMPGPNKLAQVGTPLSHSFGGFGILLYSSTDNGFHVQRLQGQVGLFFTSWPPTEILEWFESFSRPEFARMGEISTI